MHIYTIIQSKICCKCISPVCTQSIRVLVSIVRFGRKPFWPESHGLPAKTFSLDSSSASPKPKRMRRRPGGSQGMSRSSFMLRPSTLPRALPKTAQCKLPVTLKVFAYYFLKGFLLICNWYTKRELSYSLPFLKFHWNSRQQALLVVSDIVLLCSFTLYWHCKVQTSRWRKRSLCTRTIRIEFGARFWIPKFWMIPHSRPMCKLKKADHDQNIDKNAI